MKLREWRTVASLNPGDELDLLRDKFATRKLTSHQQIDKMYRFTFPKVVSVEPVEGDAGWFGQGEVLEVTFTSPDHSVRFPKYHEVQVVLV